MRGRSCLRGHWKRPPSGERSDLIESANDSPDPANSLPDEEIPSHTGSPPAAPDSDADQQQPLPSSSKGTKACGNLTVSATSTTCGFANNVFYEYWTATDRGARHVDQISAYSDRLGKWLEVACAVEETPAGGGAVSCATDAGAGIWIPYRALAEYTQAAADAYAASHKVTE